jgi:dolichol-phosphate hexosyltransferase
MAASSRKCRGRVYGPADRLASDTLAGSSGRRVSASLVARLVARSDPHVYMLSIMMPVYNERERVERAITEVLDTQLPTEFELIVVDDGSTDGTREILRGGNWDGRVRLFEHPENRGKGAAIQTALGYAEGEYAAIFDADLEYDPTDLGLLMPPLLDGRTNASFGVRAFDGYTSHSFLFVAGNKGVTFACNVLFNVYLHDIMTCHKMIRTDVFRALGLRSAGFAIEPEITARLVQRGERIFEVPVHYRARSTDEGKKLTARDGFRVLGTLLRCRFSDPNHMRR